MSRTTIEIPEMGMGTPAFDPVEFAAWLKPQLAGAQWRAGDASITVPPDYVTSLRSALTQAGYWVSGEAYPRGAGTVGNGVTVTFRPMRSLTEDDIARENLKANTELNATQDFADAAKKLSKALRVKPTWKPPAKPEPTFEQLRKEYILNGPGQGGSDIEAIARITDKVTLTIDGNGDYRWSPDPQVKLWVPPSPKTDAKALTKEEYLLKERLIPEHVKLVQGSSWVNATVIMIMVPIILFTAVTHLTPWIMSPIFALLLNSMILLINYKIRRNRALARVRRL